MLSFFYLVLICYFIFISFMMISIMEKLYDFLVQNHPNPSTEQNNETINTTEQNVMEIPNLVVETLRNEEQANCSICTEAMTGNLSSTPCGHLFHTSCLQAWMNQGPNQSSGHIRCPICRSNIQSQDGQIAVRRRNQQGQAQVELTTFSRVFNMDEVRELLENL